MDSDLVRVLLISGAALELIGIAMVGLDVSEARSQLRELSRRVPRIHYGRVKGRYMVDTAVGGPMDPSGELSLEERVAKLEADANLLKKEVAGLAEHEQKARDALSEETSRWVTEARDETAALRNELRPLIGRASAGNLNRRALGVVVFAVGLIVQTVANYGAL